MRRRTLCIFSLSALPLCIVLALLAALANATPSARAQSNRPAFQSSASPIVAAASVTTDSNPVYLPLVIGGAATLTPTATPLGKPTRTPIPTITPTITTTPTTPPSPTVFTPTKFGVDFVSQAEGLADEVRYQRALSLNAPINRWPMYWGNIEKNPLTQPGVFDWTTQDANTINDIAHGLTIDAILLGTPSGLGTSGSLTAEPPRVGVTRYKPGVQLDEISIAASYPQGLYLSVFSDGTDAPAVAKTINANNRWALFVNAAVNHYKPGGALAQQRGWTNGQGVRVWEIWNEPDFDLFWSGTITDYARLLKVAYLSAKHADPQAQIMFGGLCNCQKNTWLNDTLKVVATYSDRDANGWFFNSVATHNYSWAWGNYRELFRARQSLDTYGLTTQTLWLNETGTPVWDDPAIPITKPSDTLYRSAMQEQADYVIQAATWSAWMRAEAMLWFQLYDDFGNGCPGIDAFGLLRNRPNTGCNNSDGSPRPAYQSYQVVTRYLTGLSPYWRKRPTANQELIALQNPKSGERVVAMWARNFFTETVVISATATSAVLVYPNGITQTLAPVGGVYTLTLPAATNTTTPTSDPSAIGGDPRILIERDPAIITTTASVGDVR